MNDPRTAQRITDALDQLLPRLLTQYQDEDPAEYDERLDDALEAARETIETSPPADSRSNDEHEGQEASDLIQHYLLTAKGAEDALTFRRGFDRLRALPVLGRKGRLLRLLLLLSPGASLANTTTTSHSRSQSHKTNGLRSEEGPQADGPTQHDPEDEQKLQQAIEDAPSEAAILRDLPFFLQGLSTTHFTFTDAKTLRLPPGLPVPLISLLHTLAEPSLLYRSLAQFVEGGSEGGLVTQSLRAALGNELRDYLGLVASLEGHIRSAIENIDEGKVHQGLGAAGVTLKRCVVWTRDATMGLRLMSLIVEQSQGKKGGEIISLIHGLSASHGDQFVASFADRLLASVTRPFYDMLQHWIYDGELSDPYHEFFVTENLDAAIHEGKPDEAAKSAPTSVWEDKYHLSSAMLPSIMTEAFAKKVFLIGKSLNFLRHGCGDGTWVENYSKEASTELTYGDTTTLERSIDEAYKTTMKRLTWLMSDKFKLPMHLRALKKYILLEQGDFIALLMESLASNLDGPANAQYRHTLTAQLEHAIRSSNAQYDDADVLRRLDARMLELSHGEIGWDVFTLEYKIDAPVDVIVTPWAAKQYLKVFNFLWRVKRVEFALGSTWRRCTTGVRHVLSSPVVSSSCGHDWKVARGVCAEMIHFINQLQYYILFEVIEASWERLQEALHKDDATLDDLIAAHAAYLTRITKKGLLGSSVTDFPSQLHEILKCMLSYTAAVDGLYSYSVAEFTKSAESTARIENRAASSRWASTADGEGSDNDDGTATTKSKKGDNPFPWLTSLSSGHENDLDTLPALRQRLSSLSTDCRARLNVLLGDLAHQPDVDMRFLGVVMNFNDVYRPVRRGKRKTAATSGTVSGAAVATPAPGMGNGNVPGTVSAAAGDENGVGTVRG